MAAQSYTFNSGGQSYVATPNANATPAQQSAVASNPSYTAIASPANQGTNGYVNDQGAYVPATQGVNPPNVNTTLNASAIGSSNGQYNLPVQTPGLSSSAFVSSLPSTQAQIQSQNDTGATTSSGATSDDALRNAILSSEASITSQIGGEGQAFQNLNEEYQVPEQTQQLASLRGTIAQRTAAYTAQWNQANANGGVQSFVTGEQTQIQRTQAVELGVLGAQEQALSGNLQASQDLVNQTITHQFDPLKTQLTALGQMYTMMQDNMTESEQLQAQQNYGLQTINYQNLLSVGSSISNTLISQGMMTPAIAQSLSQAKSLSDFWSIYSSAFSGTPSTVPGDPSSGSTAQNGIVNGYDLSTYATSPNTINNSQATSTLIGAITSVPQADQAIQALHSGSPITGAMVAQAASQYGVDPTTLISVMNAETQLGTDGSAGAKSNNYGNVGNTDSAMAAGQPVKYPTPQSGVNAVASWLSQHKVTPQQVASGQTSSTTQGGETFDQLEASAPAFISAPGILNRIQSTGSAYIDLSKVDKSISPVLVSNWAKSHNVTLLNSDEVAQIKGLDNAISNVTNVVAPAWSQIAPNGQLGKIGGAIGGIFGQMVDSDTYSLNKTYRDNQENLAQQIKTLSGSAPRLGLLSVAEDALPDNSAYFAGTVPVWDASLGSDTYKDGINKLNRTLSLMNQALASYIPGDKGVPLLPTTRGGQSPSATQGNIVTAPDGRSIQITD